jgi:ribosomal 50S subunit-recycling heat shock protein
LKKKEKPKQPKNLPKAKNNFDFSKKFVLIKDGEAQKRLHHFFMRLDLFLKVSRLVLRRTLAQDLCDAGKVKLNGKMQKASREVKIGDELEISRRDKILRIRILQVPNSKQVSRAEAPQLYEVLSEEFLDDSPFADVIDHTPIM